MKFQSFILINLKVVHFKLNFLDYYLLKTFDFLLTNLIFTPNFLFSNYFKSNSYF